MPGKKPDVMQNLTEVANYVLSYLCDKNNRAEILSFLEQGYQRYNTYSRYLKSVTSHYYANRFLHLQSVINEVKKLYDFAQNKPQDNIEFVNRYWLNLLMLYFKDDPLVNEESPGVFLFRQILGKFTRYDQSEPLPLGRPMNVLFDCFMSQAKIQIHEYAVAEEKKHISQQAIERIKPVEIPQFTSNIIKSYHAEPKKMDFTNPTLLHVRNEISTLLGERIKKPNTRIMPKKIPVFKTYKEVTPITLSALMQSERFKKIKKELAQVEQDNVATLSK